MKEELDETADARALNVETDEPDVTLSAFEPPIN